jgi:hypothetical protein
MQDIYSCLFSYVQDEDISVADYCSSGNILDVFQLPLSPEAFHQYQEVQGIIQNLNMIQDETDVWSYKWGDTYSSRKYYKFIHRLFDPPTPFSCIWKSKLWPKLKVFAWLLLSDRLNARNMLKRRHLNIGNNFSCALYTSGDEETLEHLFFYCHFSTSCWSRLNITWNGGIDKFDMICQVNSSFRESLFLRYSS